MANEIEATSEYQSTMDALERAKHTASTGIEYWFAREINQLLGYPRWREFESVMERARASLLSNKINPSHHFGETHKMVGLGSGSQRPVDDFFLSRLACYLIAMNGDPAKPEIAAAQAYFVVSARKLEVAEKEEALSHDEERLRLRRKVTESFKTVSGVAKAAGVKGHMQGVFHDARYQGLYGMSLKELKQYKGLPDNEKLFDRAGPLELSANDFQMNLAAEVISKDAIKGERRAITTNKSVAVRVRRTMKESGAPMPESLPLEAPIKELEKRLKKEGRLTFGQSEKK